VILERFQLTGKNALVTGSTKGMGAAIALALAEAGADVVVHGRTGDPNDICGRVREIGRRSVFVQADLSQAQACQQLVEKVVESLGAIDILVNNAGIIRRSPVSEFRPADWDDVIAVNLTAAFRLCQLAGKCMLERGTGGKIVNIASLLSFQGGILVPSYAAAKGGLVQLTKALANEWASRGINVNAVAPGYMATGNTAALRNDPVRSRQILERIPSGRWGEPCDVAGAAVFLCSPASEYVHGHVLAVDGGWLAR
jgi:2-deoxy-D-gluconate 3-dehydrogenase